MRQYVLALAAATLVAACIEENDPTVEIDPVDDTVNEGETRGVALAEQARAELSGNSFQVTIGMTASILATINDSRIQEAVFAANVVLGDDAFDFAEHSRFVHQEANTQLDTVVRTYGVPYIPSTTADTILADSQAELSTLRASAPGYVDFVYLQGQVVLLTESLVLLDELTAIVGPGDMADYIADLHVVMDDNLMEATDLLEDFY